MHTHAHTTPMHRYTLTHMHTQYACLQDTPLHTCTGTAGAGVHNPLPRTSEEEEGRHIILFPLVQMTSPPWHRLCFDRCAVFSEHGDMGPQPSPRFCRWELRFLAMNLPEQNDLTTEELGGPRRVRYISRPPLRSPGPSMGADRGGSKAGPKPPSCFPLEPSLAGGTWSIGSRPGSLQR